MGGDIVKKIINGILSVEQIEIEQERGMGGME